MSFETRIKALFSKGKSIVIIDLKKEYCLDKQKVREVIEKKIDLVKQLDYPSELAITVLNEVIEELGLMGVPRNELSR